VLKTKLGCIRLDEISRVMNDNVELVTHINVLNKLFVLFFTRNFEDQD